MGRLVAVLATAVLLAAACGPSSGTPAPAATAPGAAPEGSASMSSVPAGTGAATVGRAYVDAIARGDTVAAEAMQDDTMRAAAPAAALGQLWTQFVGQYGAYRALGDVTTTQRGAYAVAIVPALFENATLTLSVAVDAAGKVAGFHVEAVGPATSPAPGGPETSAGPGSSAAPAPTASPAAYVDPAAFTETEVTVGSAPWALPGTLSMPKGSGPFPAAVLVAGSGPNDRDETIGPNRPLRDIAWGLASQGIAVLRYDKRTRAYPAAVDPDTITVREEVTDDAAAAIDLLRATPGVDPGRIFVVGHSLGGYLAPRIAAENAGDIRGAVMIEAPHTPLPDLALAQVEYLAGLEGSPAPDVQAKVDAFRQQVALADSPDLTRETPRSALPLGMNAAYLLDLRAYDPLATAAALAIPLLFIQGGRDYQVTPAELAGWKTALAGRPDVTYREYPALDHLLLAGDGPGTPAEYMVPGHVDAAVVADIAAWIASH